MIVTLSSFLTAWPVVGPLFLLYLLTELLFLVVFYCVLVPRCNQLVEPQDYRDYGRHRQKLMLRIMRRMEGTCRATGTPFLPAFATFLRDWFMFDSPTEQGPKFLPVGSNCEEKKEEYNDEYIPSLHRNTTLPRSLDVDSFFAWAFFGKDYSMLDGWMLEQLKDMYAILEKNHNIQFAPGRTRGVQPMRLTLDKIQPSFRPLLVYLVFFSLHFLGNLFLRMTGFRLYKTSNGLRYWYRSKRRMLGHPPPTATGASSTEEELLPMVFCHGIAPGGLTLYLPMILWGFGRDGRALYLFENPPVSFRLFPRIHNEAETVNGVVEAVNRHHGPDAIVSLLAHSFGSCQATWLFKSNFAHRIRQATLMDPVSIMLSEPDVMTNFLYQRRAYKDQPIFNKIGVVANELYIEYYLRRHFAWYNSELWLEDVPNQCKLLICLSSGDEILNAAKIKREVDIYAEDIGGSMHNSSKGGTSSGTSKLELVMWEGEGHGYCISCPKAWKQTRSALRIQEQLILKEESLKDG